MNFFKEICEYFKSRKSPYSGSFESTKEFSWGLVVGEQFKKRNRFLSRVAKEQTIHKKVLQNGELKNNPSADIRPTKNLLNYDCSKHCAAP